MWSLNKHSNSRTFYFILILLFLSALSCKKKPPVQANAPAWYKNDLIYNLDVKTFKDSDGDGRGDFKGLTGKLNYLQSLGVNIIWLAPFQPTADKDDGYDVTDYFSVDKRLGTEADFTAFLSAAKSRHIKVIMDMILNHTSDQHPWFIESEKDSLSPKHKWYLWKRKKPSDWNEGMGFPVVEKETWRLDTVAKAYYFHRFYHFEPDLNYQNPAVEKEAEHILTYWLNKGVDGFRLDAVPFVIDDPWKNAKNPKEDFTILHRLVAAVKNKNPNALILGEANVAVTDDGKYFGEKHNCLDMIINFYGNQYLFYGLAKGDIKGLVKALNDTKPKPPLGQWAWFLRNHDEVDLGRLSSHERSQAFKKFGPDTNMQLYKRGVRRRLAPMLDDNLAQMKMAYSQMLSLPGTPVLRYGEEIGMGDNLQLKERLAIRTPMQWENTANGGFSTGQSLFRPVIDTGKYGIQKINVSAEAKDTSSLYSFIKHCIALRKACPEIGNGQWEILNSGSDHILAVLYNDVNSYLLVCHNFDNKAAKIKVDLSRQHLNSYTVLQTRRSGKTLNGQLNTALPAYGFAWYRLQ